MSLPALLRLGAAALEQSEPHTAEEIRDRVDLLQQIVTAASWLKAELSRGLPGFLPLIGHRSEQ